MAWDFITTHFRISNQGFSVSWLVAFIGVLLLWANMARIRRKLSKDD